MGTLADWTQVAVGGGFLAAMIVLVRLALGSERRRADDWRQAAETTAAANKVMAANVDKLVMTVEQLASTQRDMMGLLQRSESERRVAMEQVVASQQHILALLQHRSSS